MEPPVPIAETFYNNNRCFATFVSFPPWDHANGFYHTLSNRVSRVLFASHRPFLFFLFSFFLFSLFFFSLLLLDLDSHRIHRIRSINLFNGETHVDGVSWFAKYNACSSMEIRRGRNRATTGPLFVRCVEIITSARCTDTGPIDRIIRSTSLWPIASMARGFIEDVIGDCS